MSIEQILNIPLYVGRKTISYVGTDPAGELSLLTGYKLMDSSPALSVPFILFGICHIPYMVKKRKKLDKIAKQNNGLNRKILELFNKSSWCSHRVAIAYTFGQGKYNEFRELLNKYSLKYYIGKLGENIKEIANSVWGITKRK